MTGLAEGAAHGGSPAACGKAAAHAAASHGACRDEAAEAAGEAAADATLRGGGSMENASKAAADAMEAAMTADWKNSTRDTSNLGTKPAAETDTRRRDKV